MTPPINLGILAGAGGASFSFYGELRNTLDPTQQSQSGPHGIVSLPDLTLRANHFYGNPDNSIITLISADGSSIISEQTRDVDSHGTNYGCRISNNGHMLQIDQDQDQGGLIHTVYNPDGTVKWAAAPSVNFVWDAQHAGVNDNGYVSTRAISGDKMHVVSFENDGSLQRSVELTEFNDQFKGIENPSIVRSNSYDGVTEFVVMFNSNQSKALLNVTRRSSTGISNLGPLDILSTSSDFFYPGGGVDFADGSIAFTLQTKVAFGNNFETNIIKASSDGNIEFCNHIDRKVIAGRNNTNPMAIDSEENIYVLIDGNTDEDDQFYTNVNESLILLKMDSSGNLIYKKALSSPLNSNGFNLYESNSKSIQVGDEYVTIGFNMTRPTSAGNRTYFQFLRCLKDGSDWSGSFDIPDSEGGTITLIDSNTTYATSPTLTNGLEAGFDNVNTDNSTITAESKSTTLVSSNKDQIIQISSL